MLKQQGENTGDIPGCCPVTGAPPVVAFYPCQVCKSHALLSLFSLGGDISAGWSLGVFSICELSPRCSAQVSPWGHTTVSTPALRKVSVHPTSLQHTGKQLLLPLFALPAPGQGCPIGCSPPGTSHRQWPYREGLRSMLLDPACSQHSPQVLHE